MTKDERNKGMVIRTVTKSNDVLAEKLDKNYKLFLSLIDKMENVNNKASLKKLCEENALELMTSPASTTTGRIGSFPGGLVWNALNVLRVMKDLNKTLEANVTTDSLILIGLFHDLGKIGNGEQPYYLPQSENWKKDKGMPYEINSIFNGSNVQNRTLYLLNKYGVELTEQEIQAITSLTHLNQMYGNEFYNVPMLTLLLQEAFRACVVRYNSVSNLVD